MERKALEEKLASIEQQFQAQDKVRAEAEQELFRLQGDYRTTTELINQLPQEEVVKEEKSKDATTSK